MKFINNIQLCWIPNISSDDNLAKAAFIALNIFITVGKNIYKQFEKGRMDTYFQTITNKCLHYNHYIQYLDNSQNLNFCKIALFEKSCQIL